MAGKYRRIGQQVPQLTDAMDAAKPVENFEPGRMPEPSMGRGMPPAAGGGAPGGTSPWALMAALGAMLAPQAANAFPPDRRPSPLQPGAHEPTEEFVNQSLDSDPDVQVETAADGNRARMSTGGVKTYRKSQEPSATPPPAATSSTSPDQTGASPDPRLEKRLGERRSYQKIDTDANLQKRMGERPQVIPQSEDDRANERPAIPPASMRYRRR